MIEKAYADALFALLIDEGTDKSGFDVVLAQLKSVCEVIREVPDFVKLLNTPTISESEKLGIIDSAFGNKVDSYVYNFLRLVTVKGRMRYFSQMCNEFRCLYNERFNIAEITVTSTAPLTELQRTQLTLKMSGITGKTVVITEKIDTAIIGGIVVDYGNTRLDGSVKTRLAELKGNIAGIIA